MATSNQSNRSESAKSGLNITLDPIETFIFAGLQKRFTEVFEAKSVWDTSSDRTKLLQKLFGTPAAGASETKVQYPYAFLTLNTVIDSEARGNLKALSLYGISAVVMADDKKRAFRVKLSPNDFAISVEFVTNNYKDVLAYANKWVFARKNGWLRFNVLYANSVTPIAVDLDGTVPIPKREADLTNVQEYVVQTTLTVQGYMSFATLIEQQIVDTVLVSTELSAEGSSTTWSF